MSSALPSTTTPPPINGLRRLFLHSYRVVESFEAIAGNLIEQDDFEGLEVIGEDITLVANKVEFNMKSWELHMYT